MEKFSTTIERIYLGTWFQRTSLHLREIYNFLKNGQAIEGLETERVRNYWKNLSVGDVIFHEETAIDFIETKIDGITVTITEDGVILMTLPAGEISQTIATLEEFYIKKLSPAISYLFSRGAPLPKELANIKNIHPHFLVGRNLPPEEIQAIFGRYNEVSISSVSNSDMEIVFGKTITTLNFLKEKEVLSASQTEELLRNIVFFREFEQQLNSYLNLHRSIWDAIAQIRDAKDFRYRDFSKIRQRILEFLKTLAFVEARLSQMNDILLLRTHLIDRQIRKNLIDLGLDKFEQLDASKNYIIHLWQMTIEYAKGSLTLLESLYQENIQRELSMLKFITLIGAIASFFGMNIAFPWEERWSSIFMSSIIVVITIIVLCFGFYYLLRHFIYNRRFIIKK